MCIKCERRRDCLRVLSCAVDAQTLTVLATRIDSLGIARCADSGSNIVAEAATNGRNGGTVKSQLALDNLRTALVAFCKRSAIECDISLTEQHWCAMPDPIQRAQSWKAVRFIEYVAAKVVDAVHCKQRDGLNITVRLFPLVSTGYVPAQVSNEQKSNVQQYDVIWPAPHSVEWLRAQIPCISFPLDYAPNSVWGRGDCVIVSDTRIPQLLGQFEDNNDALETDRPKWNCSTTHGIAEQSMPRAYVEFVVYLPRYYLSV